MKITLPIKKNEDKEIGKMDWKGSFHDYSQSSGRDETRRHIQLMIDGSLNASNKRDHIQLKLMLKYSKIP